MTTMRWPGYHHIFFDCDSTLTAVEGIDVLAESTGKRKSVADLTDAAMNGQIGLEDVYGQRLVDINPTRKQIRDVYRVYRRNAVEDAAAVIGALQDLGHEIYIVSGGLAEPVEEFGVHLGVPRTNIRAVSVSYDQLAGEWWQETIQGAQGRAKDSYLGFDAGDLTISDGKGEIIGQLLKGRRGRSLLIGDGYSDKLAGGAVDLFVGYGGVIRRERVLASAPISVLSFSLAPLLVIAAGPASLRGLLDSDHEELVSKALLLIRKGAIAFRDEQLRAKFEKALTAGFTAPH